MTTPVATHVPADAGTDWGCDQAGVAVMRGGCAQVPPIAMDDYFPKDASEASSDSSVRCDKGGSGSVAGGRVPKRIPFIHSHLATPAVVTEESTQESQGSDSTNPRSPIGSNPVHSSSLKPQPYTPADHLTHPTSPSERVLYSFPPKRSRTRRTSGSSSRGKPATGGGRSGSMHALEGSTEEKLLAPPSPGGASHELPHGDSGALQRLGSADTMFQIVEDDEEPQTQSITLACMPQQRAHSMDSHSRHTDAHSTEYAAIREHARSQRFVRRPHSRGCGQPHTEPVLRAVHAAHVESGPRSVRASRRSRERGARAAAPQIVAAVPARGSVMSHAGPRTDCMPRRQPPPPGSPLQTRMDFLHYQLDISEVSEILEGLVLQAGPQSRIQGGAPHSHSFRTRS